MESPLVTTEWLARHTERSDLFLIDVSVDNVIGKEPIVYDEPITIPGSYKVSIDHELSDTETAGIHVFPKVKQIQQVAQKLGLTPKSTIVLYDDQGIYSAPRAWWIFKSYGFDKVFILDGGLPKWRAEGRETASDHLTSSSASLLDITEDLDINVSAVKTVPDLLENIESGISTVVDVRAEARFYGKAPEPRPGVRSGHIPKSCNLPFMNVLSSDGLTFKSAGDLNALFESQNFSSDASFIFSCGSGMTACIMLVAAIVAGYENVSLYDGSWAEWGADASLPIEL